ncbi:MAG: myxosortase-dependent M36 family metallopeptidase [Archangium sp.]|nr:myxosortase-dependent M36 family metallopeptidase [Archangium sp.]
MRHLPALLLLGATASFAFEQPNLDAFTASKELRALPDGAFDGHVSSIEPRLGVPTFFWAAPPAPGTRSPRDSGLTAEQAARRHLFAHAGLYRAAAAQLAESTLVQLHDTGQGAIVASFEKRVGGVSVFRDRLHVAMNQRLELVALSGYLSPAQVKQGEFKLAAPTAFASAWSNLLGTPVDSSRFIEGQLDEAGFRLFTSTLEQPFTGRAKKVLYPLPERLVPAWHLELDIASATEPSSSMYALVISAEDGAVLSRKNLSESEQFTYRVWAQPNGLFLPDDGPQGISASPHPTGTPNGFNPPFVMPSLVTLQNGPISTNDPWLAAGATETTGNNVDAYADLVTPDGFNTGDLRATTTSFRTFDRTYDVTLQPNASTAQQQAGITQLFFNINQLHDWFYDKGFNEAAGNAQLSNFSRGGAGADSIKAEAQDFNGTNNANMSTPADGARPRMQMYVWSPQGLSSLTASPGGPYPSGAAGFGAQVFTLTANAVQANDSVAPTNDGCTALSTVVTGRIAVVDRGNCTFGMKALNAQNAGAVGLIIVNNVASATPPSLAADTSITTVTIPVLSLTQADGATLRTNLGAGTVSITMSRAAITRRAGELDNTIVAHEWGHYLSNRLISNSAGLSNNQGRSMGEGWGDIVALMMMVRQSDLQVASNANWAGVYTPATYALLGPGFLDASYYGIRRYPYSTDFTKNPLTFKHIENGVALPVGPPSDGGGATNAEVHNSGELWAVAVFECYAALLRATPRLTFDQARDRMLRYLVAGLKLTPGQPTFTEGRDALLAAVAASDMTDYKLFAAAFARRGLGLRAVAPDRGSTTHSPVVEDFSTGNELTFVRATLDDEASYCDRDGVLDQGESGFLNVTLRNTGFDALTATTGTITSTTPGVVVSPPSLTFTNSQPWGQATAQTQVLLNGVAAPMVAVFTITFTDPTLTPAGNRTTTFSARMHTDEAPANSATDDVETRIAAWTFVKNTALSNAFDWERKRLSAGQHVWYGVNPSTTADISLVSPALNVAPSGSLNMVLTHRWDYEADAMTSYDGAVIEISTNGGTSWTDVGTAAAGYTGTLGGMGTTNPLNGRAAYTGRSPGYPAFTTTTVDLGTTFAGQTVRVRLRIGADQASAGAGWDVDSIAFTGITNTPFPRLIADQANCINRPPVARAGADRVVDEGTVVTLDSSASTDADNDPITATWTQVSGPSVALVNGVFTAPQVTADTALSFQLVVNDGTVSSTPDVVQVTVQQLNRAPIAMAGPNQGVNEAATVTLAGSGSDPDGDPVTFAWTQVAGPLGSFSDATSATSQFTAPVIGATAVVVVLELVASDGSLSSAPSRVELTVQPVNLAPLVTVEIPATAPERSTVMLTAIASDPDGDLLTYQWRQTSGPAVTLVKGDTANASFSAPAVNGSEMFGFEVTVSDRVLSSTAGGVVNVVDATNLPPVVVLLGESRTVKAGEVVRLDASASFDPDGDPLTFAWVQSAGSPVVLEGASSAVASFTMPKEGALTFVVTARDPSNAQGQGTITLTAAAASGCGCTSSDGVFFALLPLLFVMRRKNLSLRAGRGRPQAG